MTSGHGIVQLGPRDDGLLVRLTAEQSGDDLGVVELVMGPGSGGPPLHVHPTHGEGFLVLEGHLTFQVADRVVQAGPGSWLYAPREVPHTLANLGSDPGRLLCFFAPGGFERRFERILAEQAGHAVPPVSAAEQQTRAVGPSLGARHS